jgi:hypothetical protein
MATIPEAKIQTRLCPHCANSIAVDALTCPYCKADLAAASGPQWPEHSDLDLAGAAPDKQKLTVKSKAILVLGLLVFALGIYLVGGNVERHDRDEVLAERQKALQDRDQKIQSLEVQLAELRRKSRGSEQEVEGLRARLDELQKSLTATQRKLTSANREVERLAANRVAARPNPPAVQRSAARSRPVAEPRTYEAVRSTPIFEEPASSARVVAQLTKVTQITVVSSGDGWLEVRSKHGKPPGFIRADDAMFVSSAN